MCSGAVQDERSNAKKKKQMGRRKDVGEEDEPIKRAKKRGRDKKDGGSAETRRRRGKTNLRGDRGSAED
jgi:hypothetical protein